MASRPIDEKIVVMKMDNADLQKKAAETTSIFGKIKSAMAGLTGVDLSKTVNQFGNIQRSANSVNLNNLAQAVDAVANRFSTLGVIATTALTNITNKAVDAGTRLVKSLGMDQVAGGFNEYELKMRSIGTMLANTEWAGTNLSDVKKTLGELNDYADQTIYSFEQMTQNIGRFTAAGVTLEDSAIAIKGLGNLAAISGSDVNQLNTAMYQMSQALASGKLNLMDWNSLVNAGMAGKKTQDALVATARSMGKVVDLSGGFRDSIQDGWLTSEVFLATLKKFGADESMTEAATKVRTFTGMMDSLKEGIGSGWAESWEIIFGDFEQATVFWTRISDVLNGIFDKQTDARNKLLSGIFADGGLNKVLDTFSNIAKPIVQIMEAIGNGFRKAFPPTSADTIQRIISSVQNLTASLQLSDKNVKSLETIFAGFFAILSSGWQILKMVGSALMSLMPGFTGLGTGVLSLLARLAELPIAFDKSLKSGEAVGRGTEILKTIFAGLAVGMKVVGAGFQDLSSLIEQTWNILAKGDFVGGVLEEDSKIVDVLFRLREGFQAVFGYISSINIKGIGQWIVDFFRDIGDAIDWVKQKIQDVPNMFSNMFKAVSENQGWILAGGGIAGLVAIGWKIFEFVSNISKPFEKMGNILEEAGDAIGAFTLGIHVKSLLTIAIAIGILAVSFKLLADLDSKQISTGLYMIIGSLTALVGALTIMSKFDITGSFGATLAIIGLSAAVFILAGAIDKMSGLSWGEMTKGIVGLVAILGSLSGAIALMSRFGGAQMSAGALQILAIAGAVHLMISAIKDLAEIDTSDLTKGVTALGIILLELGIFIKMASGSNLGVSALGLVAIGASIKIMVSAIEDMAEIDAQAIKSGLINIGIILGEIAIFAKLTSGTGLLSAGAGMLLMAVAINALVIPITLLGSMPMDVLAQGLIAMGVALGAIALATSFMGGIIPAAIGVGLLAGALLLLVPSITALGLLPWSVLLTGIGALVLGLAALAGVSLLLAPAAVPMIAFAAAIALLGIAMLAAGAGMSLFGKGLILLSTLTAGAVAAIVATLGTLITGLITLLPAITDLVLKIVNAIIDVMVRMIPKIAESIATLLLALLTKVEEYLPKFIEKGADIIVALLKGLEDNMPRVIEALVSYVMTMLETMTETLRNNGVQFTNQMMQLMGEVLIIVVNAGLQMVNALFGWVPGVSEATAKIGKTAEQYIRDNFGAEQAGKDKGTDFSTALTNTQGLAQTAGKTIAESGKTGVQSVKTDSLGTNFGEGFAKGISAGSVLNSVVNAAKGLAESAYNAIKKRLDIHSPSRETEKLGKNTGQGFSKGISKEKKKAEAEAKKVAAAAVKGFKKGMDAADYKLKMGTINTTQYVAEVEKLKKTYAKYPELVQKANLAIQAAQKKTADEQLKYLENQYKLGEITSEKYIEELEKMKAAYAKQPTEIQKIQLKMQKAEEDAAKKRAELRKKEHDEAKANIENRKYYNDLSMAEELVLWEKMRKKYKEGTDERKEADREVYRLKNEINRKLIDTNTEYTGKINDLMKKEADGIKALNDEYENARIERAKSLANFVGIFDEVTKNEEITGTKLLENLRGQLTTFAEWTANIQNLATRGLDASLLETLRDMGPKAAGEIAALNTLTDDQLKEYAEIWKAKNELAKTEATGQLQELRVETGRKIEELRADTTKQLDIYKQEWLNKMREIKEGTKDQFVSLNSDMSAIGINAMNGLKQGLESKRSEVMALASEIAGAISSTIQAALDINSPSRVTTELGEYTGEGLVVGLRSTIPMVAKTARDVALTAKDTLNSAIKGLAIPDVDNEVVIRAVVEYDNSQFDKLERNLTIVPDVSYANIAAASIKEQKRQNDDKVPREIVPANNERPNVTIDQKMYFEQRNLTPSEVARKNLQASRQLVAQII